MQFDPIELATELDAVSENALAEFAELATPCTLPKARVVKLMRADPGISMISADTPLLVGQACHYFIVDITARAVSVAQTLGLAEVNADCVAIAISLCPYLDFLIDVCTVSGPFLDHLQRMAPQLGLFHLLVSNMPAQAPRIMAYLRQLTNPRSVRLKRSPAVDRPPSGLPMPVRAQQESSDMERA